MKDRLLNVLLATFAFLIVFNLFLPKPNTVGPAVNTVTVSVNEKSLTVPSVPVVSIHNSLSGVLSFDTCAEFEILKDYRKLELDGNFRTFCKKMEIAPGKTENLDFTAITRLFEIPGKYAFKFKGAGVESVADTEVSERGAFRTFLTEVFYRPVLNLFVFLIDVLPGHSLGYAIIAITILIRFVLLIPQHHILVSSRKMQAIQPKVKEIQKKFEGDQAKIGMELMDLYKREGVNPLGSCLPLLIQMPILIVLYWVIFEISDPSNRYFFYSFLSDFDPSKISTVFYGLDLKAIGGIAGAILAVTVGVLQFFQVKISLARNPIVAPAPKALEKMPDGSLKADEPNMMDPEFMNKFMLWGMPLIVALSTYFFPAGIGIYWFIGTLFMLVQQVVANKIADAKKKA